MAEVARRINGGNEKEGDTLKKTRCHSLTVTESKGHADAHRAIELQLPKLQVEIKSFVQFLLV